MKDKLYYMNLNYDYNIKFDEADKIFVITVPQLVGCMSHGNTPVEAVAMIEEAKESWIEAALESNITIPEPEDKDYSGKFVIRVPKSLHKSLTLAAKEEGVSLNQYVLYKLSV